MEKEVSDNAIEPIFSQVSQKKEITRWCETRELEFEGSPRLKTGRSALSCVNEYESAVTLSNRDGIV